MLKRTRWFFWSLFVVFLIYMGVSVYFMEHFFPGTVVNERNVDFQTTAQAEDTLLQDAQDYELVLQEQGGRTERLDREKLGVSFCKNDEVKQVKRMPNGFLWPRMFWQTDIFQVGLGTQFAEETLEATLQSLDWIHQGEEAEDAWIEMLSSGYRLHKEKQGTQIDIEHLKAQIQSAVSNLQPVLDLQLAGCYQTPAVTAQSEEILELQEKLDKWFSAEVTYAFGPETIQVDKRAVSSFITLEGLEAALNPEAVSLWVAGMAEERDTYKTQRKFKSTMRGIISVKGGNTGWQIDQETESAALLALVEQGEQLTKEPAYLHTGNPWSENYDIGDTYIEIDITAQRMWVYKDGVLLVETDVVTGNMRRGYDTPEMVAAVKYKARNAVLRGEGYASPVKYWMPFYGNYGIHDASWRSKFGGAIYKTNGSHGCVNTPRDAMSVIFENVEKGTPVILYY